MGSRKKDEEENGVLDTMGDAVKSAASFLFQGGRDFSEKGLKEMAKEKKPKEKPKKVKKKPKATPTKTKASTNTSVRQQVSASPTGASFFNVTEADLRKARIAQRIADLKKRQEENK